MVGTNVHVGMYMSFKYYLFDTVNKYQQTVLKHSI